MPKDGMPRSLTSDRSKVSPYPRSSKKNEKCISKNPLPPVREEKEWEDARCPICMEHPHNAVLLLCSSNEKGCRPYMCNTSSRHSNCLDRFCESFGASSLMFLSEIPLSNTASHRGSEERLLHQPTMFSGRGQPKLVCPLCRGQINGLVVIEPVRQFLNSKPRNCSLETCGFSGTYSELRRHARLQHPSVRPSEADPRRQRDWTKLERERDLQDMFSAYLMMSGYEGGEDSILQQQYWLNLEQEMDLEFEDIFSMVPSESEGETNEDSQSLLNFGPELPFSFLEDLFPFHWF